MLEKNYFKDEVKKRVIALKSSPELFLSEFSRYTRTFSKLSRAAAIAATFTLSSCSTIEQKVAEAAEALKTDAQTAHDENFRIKRVRKALIAGDILGAEEHRDTLRSKHWKCIANIEIAAIKYPSEVQEALQIIETASEEIWHIADANKRAMALLALLKFELETKNDAAQAKETVKQLEKTIAFIMDDHVLKMKRYGEFQKILTKHNHLLSK